MYEASNPGPLIVALDLNWTYMAFEVEVTFGGIVFPLNLPNNGALMVVPSYTVTVSLIASVSNAEKLKVTVPAAGVMSQAQV